ncbi:MAG: antibiotic biosynthesis monooxygenase [Eubacterium sp.]|nr:antibiotic biosynthesis monooxygenase [Eubacterium sp.]
MIKIVAKMHLKEGALKEFKELTVDLVAKAKAEEGSCGEYSFNRNLADPCDICVVEFWKDQAAIDFHNNTEHFTTTFPKLAALCDRDPVVELFEEI